jgi:hypothetical protein
MKQRRQTKICIAGFLLGMFFTTYSESQIQTDNSSDSSFENIEHLNISSALRVGDSGDGKWIPALKTRLNDALERKENPQLIRALRKALAKLGDATSRQCIIEEMDNSDLYIQYNAMEDAGYVGGDAMICKIAEKLYDPSPGGRVKALSGGLGADEAIAPPRHTAVVLLSKIIKNESAPQTDTKKITYSEQSVQEWQKWWDHNKLQYLTP